MLSESDLFFLKFEMCIVINSIYSKLSEENINPYQNDIENSISFFIKCIKDNPCNSIYECEAEKEIKKYFLTKNYEEKDAKSVLDVLRYDFCSFARGGLRSLYLNQEKQNWSPQIIINKIIEPNSIDALPENIILYRGTSYSEFKHKNYGQSWTTNIKTANEFAYIHYQNQPWFDKKNRVVLKTNYSKSEVFYASDSYEYEVVINTETIKEVELVT